MNPSENILKVAYNHALFIKICTYYIICDIHDTHIYMHTSIYNDVCVFIIFILNTIALTILCEGSRDGER